MRPKAIKLPSRFLEQAPTDYGLPLHDRWLITTPPKTAESLASWVARLADKLGTTPTQLLDTISGDTGIALPTLCRDIDGSATDAVVSSLAVRAGIGRDAVARLTPATPLGRLTPAALKATSRFWLLRYRIGDELQAVTQWCSQCLAEAQEPFLRLSWRFGWNVACPAHGLRLLDACPACGKHLVVSPRTLITIAVAGNCPHCSAPLSSEAPLTHEVSPAALDVQTAINRALQTGQWLPTVAIQSSLDALLDTIRSLNEILATKARHHDDEFFVIGDRERFQPRGRAWLNLGQVPLAMRHDILRMIGILLTDWPHKMAQIAEQYDFPAPWHPRSQRRRSSQLGQLFQRSASPVILPAAPVVRSPRDKAKRRIAPQHRESLFAEIRRFVKR